MSAPSHTPDETALNDAVESIMRVCKGMPLIEIQNVLSATLLNILFDTVPEATPIQRYQALLSQINILITQHAEIENSILRARRAKP